MKVIIDTNILVSAVLKDRDPERVIQFIADNPQFEWVASQEILTEYKEVLSRRKFRLTEAVKSDWFSLLDVAVTIVEVAVYVDFPTDPKDAMFLACAIAADADLIITGDTDLFQAENLQNTAVITLAAFKEQFFNAF
jgi:uncharacterized protein